MRVYFRYEPGLPRRGAVERQHNGYVRQLMDAGWFRIGFAEKSGIGPLVDDVSIQIGRLDPTRLWWCHNILFFTRHTH